MTDAFVRGAVVVLLTLSLPLHVFGVYALLLLGFAGLWPRGPRGPKAGAGDLTGTPRIAVIIVAHDEERVIADSVASLTGQRYPSDAYAVFVVADHCTDRTAEVARALGARVLERDRGGANGKSFAVAFGIEAAAAESRFDAVAIFDADNVADPDFLEKIGARLASGERVVQGFVDSKNPSASWVAGSSALGFWAIAELGQAPRERLSLSAPLMGTGFAMRLDDATLLLSTASALTDDLDLGARLGLSGTRVAYEAGARTVDEKPTRLGVAVAQRHRWMQGRWAVAGRHLPELVQSAFARTDGLGARLRALDVAVQLILPSLLFTAVATALLAGAAATIGALSLPFAPSAISWSLAAAACYFVAPVFGIARHRPGARVWLCYLVQPVYLALSLPLAVTGFFSRRGSRWVRTPKGV